MNKSIFRAAPLGFALAILGAVPLFAQQYDQYVALGDSLTAGWESGCLVQRNQVNSYPAVLSKILYGGDFEQPLVSEVAVTSDPAVPKCLGAVLVPPATISIEPLSQMGDPLNALLPRPYNNLGMPGAEVGDLTQLTSVNPNGSSLEQISALVLRNFPGSPFNNTNAVEQAASLLAPASHAIETLWIGNNNVLGASTSGIVVDGVTLISQADFQQQFDAILAGVPPGTTLVVATVADVTAIPFSTTIPPVLVDPTTLQPVLIGGAPVPLLGQGDAGFPCTPVPPDLGCALPPDALVNLPASSLIATGIGIPTAACPPGLTGCGLPLPHGFIDSTGTAHPGVTLYPDEITLLQQRTGQYNDVIRGDSAGAVVVDTNARLLEIKANGYLVGGIQLTTAFLTGGIFSFDGVHPSTIGYSIVADVFIQAINAQTSSNFPRPDISSTLFTPNPPSPGASGAAIAGGGAWGYTYDMWRDVLASVRPERAGAYELPTVRAPRATPRPAAPRTTRAIVRHDRDQDRD